MAEAADDASNYDNVLEDSSTATTKVVTATTTGGVMVMPKIVTPLTERKLTAIELEKLQEALNSQKIAEITKAILSIDSLTSDIKKSMFPKPPTKSKSTVRRPRIVATPQSSTPTNDTTSDESNRQGANSQPFVVKKRAPRSQPKEPRRPWKPERLDTSKPILQCDACGYQANRRDYMRRHQLRVHSDYRPYQCNLCDFKTTEKHDLDRHLASKYHGGKGITPKRSKLVATVRIKCDKCSYSSKSVQGILRHKQSHNFVLPNKRSAPIPEQEETNDATAEHEEIMQFENQIYEENSHTIPIQHEGSDDGTGAIPDAVTVLMMDDLIEQANQQQ